MPGQSAWKAYRDFIVRIERSQPEGFYRAEASGPAGEAETTFRLPFDERDLRIFLLEVGRPRRAGVRALTPEPIQPVVDFGLKLYNSVFSGSVRDIFVSSRHDAEQNGYGLRVQLRLIDAPELASLPWEYLYDGRNFLALTDTTPIVRYLDLPDPPRPMLVELPLRILVTISSPADLPPLNVREEERKVREALAGLTNKGLIQIGFTADATLGTLQRTLRQAKSAGKPYHVWHYIGHGIFDEQARESVLMFVNDAGVSYRARGFQLGTLFNSYPEVRLALLNACEGARPGQDDPFGGVAAALVERGAPAVIGMQFEITDEAAIVFAAEFYAALVDGLPVDGALTEARRGVFFLPNWIEWATPVLFMRVQDGRLFEMSPTGSFPVPKEQQRAFTAPTQSRKQPRMPVTTFLGKAFEKMVSDIGQLGTKLPDMAPSSPVRPVEDPSPASRYDPETQQKPVPRIKLIDRPAPARLVYLPMPYQPGPSDRHLLSKPWKIRLEIRTPTRDGEMGVALYGEAIVGRNINYAGQPIIDLEPYGAKDLGVSRQHLVIRPTRDGLVVIDQGSTNGTFINGIRSGLGAAIPVREGDVLLLSQMEIVLHIIEQPA